MHDENFEVAQIRIRLKISLYDSFLTHQQQHYMRSNKSITTARREVEYRLYKEKKAKLRQN